MDDRSLETALGTKTKDHKWAEHFCYVLIAVLNLSSWIDLNSVWVEMPLIVNSTPEYWALPSLLSLIISLANIFPLIVLVIRCILGDRFSEIPFIYAIITLGSVACLAIGLFWKHTLFIFGAERSYALIIAVFALGMLDCTSSLVFCDYMKRFKAKYLHAMFMGESFTATIPTLIAMAQGIGGEVQCRRNNLTSAMEPIYTEPRFSVSTFFFLITGIILTSLVAFLMLQKSSLVELAKAADRTWRKETTETSEMLPKTSETVAVTCRTSIPAAKSMTRKQFHILQWFNVINSGILYGCLPTLITYSLLPYGQKAFYYCSILAPVAYPLSALLALYRPTISMLWIVAGSIFGCSVCCFIIVIACQSPCPMWADTVHGGVTMTIAWFSSSFVLAYVRIASGNSIKSFWKKDDGLFHFGLSVQMGIIFGVVPFYLAINVFKLLKERAPCVIYCM